MLTLDWLEMLHPTVVGMATTLYLTVPLATRE